jgi:ribosomal protein S18 acetylase RimI-like enzyme
MTNLLTDTTKDALIKVSEDHYFDSFTCFSGVPGVEVYRGEDMIRIASPGIPNWLTNTVCRCRLSPDNADTAINETGEYFRARGVKPYWRLCPGDTPSDLGGRLVKSGFSLIEEQPAMAVDLRKLNEDVTTPAGFVIERVPDAATLEEKHGWIRRLGAGRSLGTLLMGLWTAYGFDPDSEWQHYVGLLNGEPVAWASLFCATGVAGIYAVGTLPEARGQGLGSAMTLRPLLDARHKGYRVGVLQSSAMGYNMYRRLGFETCFNIKSFAPASPPPAIHATNSIVSSLALFAPSLRS